MSYYLIFVLNTLMRFEVEIRIVYILKQNKINCNFISIISESQSFIF